MFKKTLETQETQETQKPFDLSNEADRLIELLRARGIAVNRNELTPLMIYAAADRCDERFITLLQGPRSEIVKVARHLNTTGLSAFTFAVICGSKEAMQLLLAANAFSDEHKQEAVLYAAMFNQAKMVTILHHNGVYLFKPFFGVTALHLACLYGYTDVAKAILETNPSDREIGMPTLFPRRITAYELAKENHHTACTDLLKCSSSALFAEKNEALKRNDLVALLTFIKHDTSANPFVGDYFNRSETFISVAIYMTTKNTAYLPIFTALYDVLKTYPLEVRINTLLLTLSQLELDLEDNEEDLEKCNQLNQFYHQLLQELKELSKQINTMTIVSLNGFYLSDQLIAIVKPLLRKTLPAMIDLTYDLHDEIGEKQNLLYPSIAGIVNEILNNTNLIHFDLLTDRANQPYVRLIQLVIKRNELMQKESLPILKNKIYNLYVEKINNLIEAIKTNQHLKKLATLDLLKLIHDVPSLKEISACFVSKTCSKAQLDILPAELKELTSMARLPFALMQFGKVYKSIVPTSEDKKEINALGRVLYKK